MCECEVTDPDYAKSVLEDVVKDEEGRAWP